MVHLDRRGHLVIVHFRGWRERAKPEAIEDHEGRRWRVVEILDYRRDPRYGLSGKDKLPYDDEAERWFLIIDGPLPYRRGRGRQHAAIRSFGDGAGWYLVPDQTAGPSQS